MYGSIINTNFVDEEGKFKSQLRKQTGHFTLMIDAGHEYKCLKYLNHHPADSAHGETEEKPVMYGTY